MFVRSGSMLLLVVLLGAACGGETAQPRSDDETPAEESIKVGLALPGPIDDGGFNQQHYEGLQQAQTEFGIEFTHQDNLGDPQQHVDALRNLAAVSDLVIAAGGQFADPLSTVAPEFPQVHFVITAGVAEGENITSLVKNWAEQSYIAGVLAASVTRADSVSFVGGLEIPPTLQADAGYRAGVESVNPDVSYASTNIGTFNDPGKAKEAASAQIDSGNDVIQGFVDAAEPGIIEAVEDSGEDVLIIAGGHDKDFCDRSSSILAATPPQTDIQVLFAIEQFVAGELPPFVEVTLATLDDESFAEAFVLCPEHERGGLSQLVEETKQGIVEGSIKVPTE